jgi:hypothetical protein
MNTMTTDSAIEELEQLVEIGKPATGWWRRGTAPRGYLVCTDWYE